MQGDFTSVLFIALQKYRRRKAAFFFIIVYTLYYIAISLAVVSKENYYRKGDERLISKQARVLKWLSGCLPRRLLAVQFSLKQSTLDIIEVLWKFSRIKKPIFRRRLITENFKIGSVVCEWLYARPEQKERVIFFLHGGGYLKGGLSGARNRSMKYAVKTSASIFIADYRSSAVAPFPAALDDSILGYEKLLEVAPDAEIILLGDSAGGGLALAVMEIIKEKGLRPPKIIIVNSPWTDLNCDNDEYEKREKTDVILQKIFLEKCAKLYADGAYNNPYVSPIFADFSGFPPMYIHVGTDEILCQDSISLAEKVKEQGGEVHLHVWEGMFHMFHYLDVICPESAAACKEIYSTIDEL